MGTLRYKVKSYWQCGTLRVSQVHGYLKRSSIAHGIVMV